MAQDQRKQSPSLINVKLPSENTRAVSRAPHPSPVPLSSHSRSKKTPNGITPSTRSNSEQQQHNRNLERLLAARTIERCWCSFRDKQMFKLLKHAVCAAEHSLTYEVLRKVIPVEAELLKDPSVRARVRFRFAGPEFPPVVLFKVYTHTEGTGLQYYSGKTCIKPASEAASDACRMMGHRLFYDQMIADTCQREKDLITDEVDVTTTKDYMQYLSNLDEMPAHMGGRDNLWRRLDLNVLPRTTILYDILDFLEKGGMPSPRLRSEMPVLTKTPVTQEMQLEHIRLISKIRTPLVLTPTPRSMPGTARTSQPGETSRRSRQAMQRASKMRKAYSEGTHGNSEMDSQTIFTGDDQQRRQDELKTRGSDDEEWEHEADQLYAWTQNLCYEDIGLTSPC